jgi:hypothetical protein
VSLHDEAVEADLGAGSRLPRIRHLEHDLPATALEPANRVCESLRIVGREHDDIDGLGKRLDDARQQIGTDGAQTNARAPLREPGELLDGLHGGSAVSRMSQIEDADLSGAVPRWLSPDRRAPRA